MQTYYDITYPLANNQQEEVESLYITYDGSTPIGELPKFINLKHLEITLRQPLPTQDILGELSNLERLVISDKINDLKAVCRLVNLRELLVCDVTYSDFKIPENIKNLVNLELLSFKNTSISELPPQIGLLQKLHTLGLANNTLLSELPAEIYQLYALKTLHLQGCPIKYLSEEISQLVNLENLNIEYTNITAFPEAFALRPLALLLFYGTPVYDGLGVNASHYNSFINNLFQKVPDLEKRKTFFNFFCGYYERIKAQNMPIFIQDAFNFSDKSVRMAAMSYWYRHYPSPFPPTQKMVLYLAPTQGFNWDWDTITPILQDNDIAISPKLNANVTHLIVGGKPGLSVGKAQRLQIPIVSYGHLRDYLQTFDDTIYLHQQDADTLAMAENLHNLLQSDDITNITLGLQMALGGGLNDVYLYDILLLHLWEYANDMRKLATKVLEKYLPIDAFLHVKTYQRTREHYPSEETIYNYLSTIAQHKLFDADKLAVAFYEKFNVGVSFCLANPKSFVWYCNKKRKNSVLHLKELHIRSFPDTIKELKNIKILYLQKNYLTNLPLIFAKLAQLDTLNLDNNQFTQFPTVLTDMPHIVSLSIANNQLATLPAEIGKMQGLQTLNLHNNKIAVLPEAIFDLPALRRLEIGGSNPLIRQRKLLQTKMPYCEIVVGK